MYRARGNRGRTMPVAPARREAARVVEVQMRRERRRRCPRRDPGVGQRVIEVSRAVEARRSRPPSRPSCRRHPRRSASSVRRATSSGRMPMRIRFRASAGATRCPERLRDDAEHRAAVEREEPVAERHELQAAQAIDGDATSVVLLSAGPVRATASDHRRDALDDIAGGRVGIEGARADRVHDRRATRIRAEHRVDACHEPGSQRARAAGIRFAARRRCPQPLRRMRSEPFNRLRRSSGTPAPVVASVLHDRRPPVLRRGRGQTRASLRRRDAVRSAPSRSALFTTKMSAISMMPALSACTSSPVPGTSTTIDTSAVRTMSTSSCPTPTVSMITKSRPAASSTSAASLVARASPPRWPRVAMLRMNTPASPACACMRTRSPRMAPPVKGLVGIDRDDAHGVPGRAQLGGQPIDERALARAWRAGDADQVGAPGVREQLGHEERPTPRDSSSMSEIARAIARASPASTRSASRAGDVVASIRPAAAGRSRAAGSRSCLRRSW